MLLSYCQWLETHGIGQVIRDSTWLFPFIEAFHLVAFAALGGAVLLVDLRLLGFGIGNQEPSALAKDVKTWFTASLAVMLITGLLLFLSEPVKCYDSYAFRVKISALTLAILFTVSLKSKIIRDSVTPAIQKAAGATSLVLWGLVAWGGRWIGLS